MFLKLQILQPLNLCQGNTILSISKKKISLKVQREQAQAKSLKPRLHCALDQIFLMKTKFRILEGARPRSSNMKVSAFILLANTQRRKAFWRSNNKEMCPCPKHRWEERKEIRLQMRDLLKKRIVVILTINLEMMKFLCLLANPECKLKGLASHQCMSLKIKRNFRKMTTSKNIRVLLPLLMNKIQLILNISELLWALRMNIGKSNNSNLTLKLISLLVLTQRPISEWANFRLKYTVFRISSKINAPKMKTWNIRYNQSALNIRKLRSRCQELIKKTLSYLRESSMRKTTTSFNCKIRFKETRFR